MAFLQSLKARARKLKSDTLAVWIALGDPRTPWYAKLLATVVVAYAFSPIDLIPDFIPVLGLLDDLILVPLGIALVVRLIPQEVMEQSRQKALVVEQKPVSRVAGAVIITLWLLLIVLFLWWLHGRLGF